MLQHRVQLAKQRDLWLDDSHFEYHRRQFDEPYRSTVHLGQFVREVLGDCDRPMRALDVGCGAGANIHHLATILPRTRWLGVDIAEHLFPLGQRLMAERGIERVHFANADLYRLRETLPEQPWDLAFSIQTLSWLPEYETAVRELVAVTNKGGVIFITSLFTSFKVDARIEVTQFPNGPTSPAKGPYFYNIYSIERFSAFCMEVGARNVRHVDFEIDVEIAQPSSGLMGTYTKRLDDGRLLQCSGPLVLPWKFVAVEL